MRPNNELVASNVTSSGTSYSNSMMSECWIRASFQIVCGSGSFTGTFTVQGSNDLPVGVQPNQFVPTNWNNVGSGASQSFITCSISAGTSVMIPYFETCYRYHRVQFVPLTSALGLYSTRVESKNA